MGAPVHCEDRREMPSFTVCSLLALLAVVVVCAADGTTKGVATLTVTNGTSPVTGRGFVCKNLCSLSNCHCIDCQEPTCVFITQQWQCQSCSCTCYHEVLGGK
ncbi:uncharacterized protein LOC117653456 [Thrips palmi]|uniref:Uncharacterized protein LOC117653456 n=1 Tax=Thrips palmi TaxID=161013 RepID=A0A6P9AA96_THRPL|nr:uncharacterized protein LOC117653456 [Thrips palmi]